MGTNFGPNVKSALGSTIIGAGGNKKIVNQVVVFVGIETLGGEVNLNPFGSRVGGGKNGDIAKNIGIGWGNGDWPVVKDGNGS